jgi:16S rRNA processing protein RimM
MTWDSMVTVGRIVRPHGLKGAVVVQSETDFGEERFAEGAELQCNRGGRVEAVKIATSRPFQDRWLVMFEGVETVNDAETLRDVELRVPAEALHPLAEGAHYVHDLEGCEVATNEGTRIGTVTRVDFGAGTPLLVVEPAEGGEVLVPLAAEICREIDPASKRIVVDMPEGLLDLNGQSGASRRK